MGTRNSRRPEDVRREIAAEREQLAGAVDSLREDVTGKLRGRLPLVAGAALGAGFVVAGGIGAAMRLLARRGREGKTRARLWRFAIVDRD